MGISYFKNSTILLFQMTNIETQKQIDCLLHPELNLLHDICYFVRLLETLPKQSKLCDFFIAKSRARLGPKLRQSFLLAVECLYGNINLCKSLKFTACLLYSPEAYLEFSQISMMELFAKIDNGYTPLTFAEKLHHRCLTWF